MSRQAKLDLEAILSRCEAATAGPWYVVGPPWRASWFDKEKQMYRDVPTYVVAGKADPHVGKPVCEAPEIEEYPADDADVPPEQSYDGMVAQGDADLEFIAHARTDVPQLVRALTEAANLDRAANRACEILPDGWSLQIDIEKGYGGAVLFDPDGEIVDFPCNHDDGLAGEVNDAVDFAVESERAEQASG